MADTDTEFLPNGAATLTEEEEERLKQRPADIDADVREMERRKRVEALMSSKLFREELERVLDQQINDGGDAPLLQRIREMVGGRLHSGALRGPSCVLPINDIRGIEGVGYEKGEKILRCKLAAVYRLVDLFGWTQTGINGQITARLNTAVESVLTTPRGLLPHEVTASSLVKVDMQGSVQDQGTTNFPVNVEGFSLHAAVHAARPDIRCVLHVRSGSALAVSCLQRGLLPLCHEAAALGDYALHRVPSGILDNEEKDKLVRALGPHCKVLILCNAGALCCGATLEEAFHRARLLNAAADVQMRLASTPPDQLCLIDDESRKQMYEATNKPPAEAVKWRVGGEEFEALMRMLDNAGFRTGYIYRHPLIKNDVPRPKNDVEVPPAVSSLGYLLEEEELYKQGFWKKGQGKAGERTRWLNSPNVYQKVEVLETGTNDPKKITKWVDANTGEWVQDGSPAHSSTPVKIDTLQFVPKNTNPKEFKKLQQLIKDNRRADKISAGPQSHILEGVTWDEASKLVAEDAVNTHTGDHVVLMGAASKGIIQRGYQHNATVYSAPYARNPFDHVTDTEIEDYRRAVERKGKGDYDTDLSESEAVSGAQITSPASMPSETEEESRDEHRVLRIETTQAPVRSQPEVVLSDVDTTDFLNAERAHADRTKDTRDPTPFSDDDVFMPSAVKTGIHSVITARAHHRVVGKDPNLLSDDEVFLDSAASTATSSMTSGLTSPQPPAPVVIRAQHTAVAQTVTRGTKDANSQIEALSTNKRSVHDYTRTTKFENIIKIYESHNKNDDSKTSHPKCKINLNSKLNDNVEPLVSSRSSLFSIPSIEWDGKTKSDYGFRTRSLPRQRVSNSQTLYRTRSHGGFITSYIKDPEPIHYHLPRCRSCGATNISYAWELTKEEKSLKSDTKSSVYLSVDNIPQRCIDEAESVKVKEKIVPVFKVEKVPEFVESQEFNEDNYLDQLGTSFSSENQTVIEKPVAAETDAFVVTVTNDKVDIEIQAEKENGEIYRAKCVQIDAVEDVNNTLETTEGEYHSFSDDFEEAYESPVKDLVEKDIRDYSVPINFYCDDYMKNNENSLKKSTHKGKDISKTVLEPILEESKSCYSDDFGNLSNGSKGDSDVQKLAENIIEDVVAALTAVKLKAEKEKKIGFGITEPLDKITKKVQDELKIAEHYVQDATQFFLTDSRIERVEEKVGLKVAKKNNAMKANETAGNISDSNKAKLSETDNQRKSSVEYSVASSTNELVTLDSTVEFEKHEAISELLISLLNRIGYESVNKDIFHVIKKRNKDVQMLDEKKIEDKGSKIQVRQDIDDIKESKKILVTIDSSEIFPSNDNFSLTSKVTVNLKQENKEEETTIQDITEMVTSSEEINHDNFSITKLIHDMESNINLNETILTETSDSGINESLKIAESILYYIFDRVLFTSDKKNKKKTRKKVVTVVDPEDIFSTAQTIWSNINVDKNVVIKCNEKNIAQVIEEHSGSHIRDTQIQSAKNLLVHKKTVLLNQLEDTDILNENSVINNIIVDTRNESNKNISHADNVIQCDASNYEAIENFDDINRDNQEGDLNNNIEQLLEEQQLGGQLNDFNDAIEIEKIYSATNESDALSSDDEECREMSENSIEIAEDIVYKIFNRISYNQSSEEYHLITTNLHNTANLNNVLIEKFIDHGDGVNDNKIFNETYDELNICSKVQEYLNETNKESYEKDSDIEQIFNDTFIEQPDEMNVAFIHDPHSSSSPEKYCKVFESCTESPIGHHSNRFISQDLTVVNENKNTLLGSPFVKCAPFISMSQTENSGGVKYWLSFDDSITDDSAKTRSLTGSVSERVWKKAKRIDETIPSFYGVNFIKENYKCVPNYSRNVTFPICRNKFVLINDSDVTKPKMDASTSHHNYEHRVNPKDSNEDIDDNTEVLDISSEIQAYTSATSSKFYNTEMLQQDSPQKKLLYEVQKRQRFYNTWPPFEHTIFYRIISKFRMSESFDADELETAKINSF